MGIDKAIGEIQSLSGTISAGINTVTRTTADLGLGGVGGTATYWKDNLRPAKYRGIPFGVLGAEGQFGRKNAVHSYPYRDSVWIEDLGRAARRIHVTGFLVENGAYAGGPGLLSSVIEQRANFIAAAEQPGDGELILPTLGRMSVSLLDFSTSERWDQGRVFEINLTFIEAGKREFPKSETSTGDDVKLSCTALDEASAEDFSKKVASALKQGAAVVQQAVSTVQKWTRFAQKMANNATNLYNMVGSLKGSFGRYSGGRRSGGLNTKTSSVTSAANTITTVSGLIARGAAARNAISTAFSKLSDAAEGLGS